MKAAKNRKKHREMQQNETKVRYKMTITDYSQKAKKAVEKHTLTT